MKIKLNPDQEIFNTIREGLKRTGGYSFYQVATQERQTAQSAYPCGMEKL